MHERLKGRRLLYGTSWDRQEIFTMFFIRHFFSVLLGLGVISVGRTVYGANLAPDEVKALAEIGDQLGKRDWNFSVEPCSREQGWATPNNTKNSVTCNCMIGKDNFCHVLSIVLVSQNLSGVLPPMLDRLPYLQEIDLGDNSLKGRIPPQWASLPLLNISLALNRLSGQIPKDLGKITSLTKLVLEGNQFSGNIPEELGSLVNLKRFIIAGNNFTGELPQTLANLQNMEDLRVNENRFIGKIPNFVQYMTRLRVLFLSSNNFVGELPSTYAKLTNLNRFFLSDIPFTGKMPEFIQNWTQLEKLSIQGSGFKGPIPSSISHLEKLTDLRISDITALDQKFPDLSKMKRMQYLVLRNCNISGQIPQYVWKMQDLTTLDLSFNKLTGKITNSYQLGRLDHMYLTNNLLSGSIPEWMLKSGKAFDFSDNSFMWENQMPSDCQRNKVNLFGSSSTGNNEIGVLPCLKKKTTCSKEYYSLNINCGGEEVTIAKETIYLADREPGGPSNFFRNQNWAVSSTGHFMENPRSDEDIYTVANTSILSMSNSNLYTTARVSPLSLSYYGFCLRNGKYTVRLHFAEIIMIDEDASSNLGRRIFDVYLQDKLVLKDFNIKATAGGSGKVVMKNFTAVVDSNTLEIRLYWSGKGTVSIPEKGTYGPLISAISVQNDYPIPRGKKSYVAVAGIVAAILCSLFFVLGILRWKGYLGSKPNKEQDLRGFDLQAGKFTLRQIKAATNNFDFKNKIGEGGFGSVYKGLLSDGTVIAVKQLSSKSSQGVREFVNEIGMISALQHPNLVKLYGCCIEGNQLLLIYEYMENNSLGRVLFGLNGNQLELNWSTRHKICVGIARGLAYLHEESPLKVVHRDIKATNILLDNNLNPKISDFGLAKLREEDNTHISTRVAGTIGYMAPEYAMRGYLTDKADVYSFGVVALEIISGRRQNDDHVYLVDWAYILQGRGALIELVDPRLGQEFNKEEALAMVNVALLCTNSSPVLRPMMSSVVRVLEGCSMVEGSILDPYFTNSTNNQQEEQYGFRQTQALIVPVERSWVGSSSTSCHDLFSITVGSHCSSKRG